MSEFISVVGPAAPYLLAFAGVLVALWKFLTPLRIQVRKPFYEKQLHYISLLCEVVSEISIPAHEFAYDRNENNAHHKNPYFMSRDKFWKLYFGPIKLVSDKRLLNVVERFATELKAHTYGADTTKLQQLSGEIASVARQLIEGSWGSGMNPLKDR